ncbi:hypothetical protein MNV49_007523 [Pseudohyphozyma bogoriensis]|nr:hypothetical protein MNV49_007523 [Pseudohyphozyma bogoriensis]
MPSPSVPPSDYRPFDTIPNEVLLAIVSPSLLTRLTLRSLTWVSKRFNEVATIALYSCIDIAKWDFKSAQRLIKEFVARPHLYALVLDLGVGFIDPGMMAQRVAEGLIAGMGTTPEGLWLGEEGHVRAMRAFVAADTAGLSPLLAMLDGGNVRELTLNGLWEDLPPGSNLSSVRRLTVVDASLDHRPLAPERVRRVTEVLRSAPALRYLAIDINTLHYALADKNLLLPTLQHLCLRNELKPALAKATWSPSSPLLRLLTNSSFTTIDFCPRGFREAQSFMRLLPSHITSFRIHTGTNHTIVDKLAAFAAARMDPDHVEWLAERLVVHVHWTINVAAFTPQSTQRSDRIFFHREEDGTVGERMTGKNLDTLKGELYKTPSSAFKARMMVLFALNLCHILASFAYFWVMMLQYKKRGIKWWIVRLARRPQGRYITLNLHFFVPVLGVISGGIMFGYCYAQYQVYHFQRWLFACGPWRYWVWIPFVLHGLVVSFAFFQTYVSVATARGDWKVPSPIVANVTFVATVLLLFTAMLTSAALCTIKWWDTWRIVKTLVDMLRAGAESWNGSITIDGATAISDLYANYQQSRATVRRYNRATMAFLIIGACIIVILNLAAASLVGILRSQIKDETLAQLGAPAWSLALDVDEEPKSAPNSPKLSKTPRLPFTGATTGLSSARKAQVMDMVRLERELLAIIFFIIPLYIFFIAVELWSANLMSSPHSWSDLEAALFLVPWAYFSAYTASKVFLVIQGLRGLGDLTCPPPQNDALPPLSDVKVTKPPFAILSWSATTSDVVRAEGQAGEIEAEV